MSDEAAEQWLAAAVAEVIHLPPTVLRDACSEVRKTATHHGQIIPGILASGTVKDEMRWQATKRRMALDGHRMKDVIALPSRGEVKRIGQVLSDER